MTRDITDTGGTAPGLRGWATALLAVVIMSLPAAALACQAPANIVSLASYLAELSEGDGWLDDGDQARITGMLSRISEVDTIGTLKDRGLDTLAPRILALLQQAAEVADTGRIPYPERMLARISDLDAAVAVACEVQESSQGRGDGTLYGGVLQLPALSVFGADIRDPDRSSTTVQFLMLLTAVFGIVGLLFGIDFLVRWGFAMAYNRKSCRIAAVLLVGQERCEGHVITLGRAGARFEPAQMEMAEQLSDAMERLGVRLLIGDEEIAANPSFFHEDCIDLRFAASLSLGAQKGLLKLSSIAPHPVRKARRLRPSSRTADAGPRPEEPAPAPVFASRKAARAPDASATD